MPHEQTRFRLLEPPALGLLDAMMVAAQRSQPALTGESALVPGDRVVQVASGRGPTAAGGAAASVARPDQVLELAAGPVSGLGLLVIAVAPGDGGQSDPPFA